MTNIEALRYCEKVLSTATPGTEEYEFAKKRSGYLLFYPPKSRVTQALGK